MRFINQNLPFKTMLMLMLSVIRCISSPKRFFNFLKLLVHWKKKRISINNALPFFVMIEPTTRCILECKYCAKHQLGVNKRKTDLELKDFRKIIDEIGEYLYFIFYWNWGEPFLNKDIFDMISYANEKKIFGIISTDGLILNEKNCNKLIDSRLDYLILSCNAANREEYKNYSGKDLFERFIMNTQTLMKVKKARKSRLPFVNLQFVVSQDNENQIDLMQTLAGELGIDRLTFKKLNIYDKPRINHLAPITSEYKHRKYIKDQDKENFCIRAWSSLAINCDGSVVCCCGDVENNFLLGNIKNQSIKDIWNGKEYQALRRRILEDINSIPMCQRCPDKNTFATSLLIK